MECDGAVVGFFLSPTSPLTESPAQLRRHYRQLRLSLDADTQLEHARSLKQRLERLLRFSRPRQIAGYLACNGEISLDPWLQDPGRHHAWLPLLHEVTEPRLRFAPVAATRRWKRNRYGIIEPAVDWGETRDARGLDWILMPLLAFDRQGNRLGMGGGFYDRSLAFRRSRRIWDRPRLIGIAHALQEHPALPHQPWDVPLDAILTERELILPGKRVVT